jgi:hypothetical protein
MIENKEDYYAGLILQALILKEKYLVTASIWGGTVRESHQTDVQGCSYCFQGNGKSTRAAAGRIAVSKK